MMKKALEILIALVNSNEEFDIVLWQQLRRDHLASLYVCLMLDIFNEANQTLDAANPCGLWYGLVAVWGRRLTAIKGLGKSLPWGYQVHEQLSKYPC